MIKQGMQEFFCRVVRLADNDKNAARVCKLNGKVVKVLENRNLTDRPKPGSYIIREQSGNRTNGRKITTVK